MAQRNSSWNAMFIRRPDSELDLPRSAGVHHVHGPHFWTFHVLTFEANPEKAQASLGYLILYYGIGAHSFVRTCLKRAMGELLAC